MEGVINGADDARKAVRQRYKDGAEAANFLVTHLQQPDQNADVQRKYQDLIAQLDALDFADRERAYDELRELREQARPAGGTPAQGIK